jgi:hypothetical protein
MGVLFVRIWNRRRDISGLISVLWYEAIEWSKLEICM